MENKGQSGGDLVPIGVEALELQAAEVRETRRVLERFGYQDTTFDQLVVQVRLAEPSAVWMIRSS